jgi:hypothetical protein
MSFTFCHRWSSRDLHKTSIAGGNALRRFKAWVARDLLEEMTTAMIVKTEGLAELTDGRASRG